MAENYSQSVIRAAVGQICKSVGFDSINKSALEVLVDFAERHAVLIGRKSRRYAEQFGRTDPTIDDLEMAFKEVDISTKEMVDFKKSIDPVTLSQEVYDYPIKLQPAVKLFIPELDDDGKVIISTPLEATQASGSTNLVENGSRSKADVDASPHKHPSKSISRLMEGVVNTRFRMRSDLMIEDGEISSIFDQGKAPSFSRPPVPRHEITIPKVTAEPSTKPKIKTGVLKPKPKAPVVVTPPPEPEVLREPEPLPEVVIPRHKPPKKVEKRKKKKAVAQPEAFSDIFGAPLQQPTTKASKVAQRQSAARDDVTANRSSSAVSQVKEEASLFNMEPSTDKISDEALEARMKKVDDTIDSVLASTEKESSRDPFTFNDLQVSPARPHKSPTKKSKPRSRSPSKRNLQSELEQPEEGRRSDGKKEKSKKKSRRTQLLERFAAAPIADVHSEEPPPVAQEKVPTPEPPSPAYSSADESRHQEEELPPATQNLDEEDDIVNVDECSDVDILEADSPMPSPKNPFQGYNEPLESSPLSYQHSAVLSPPLDYQSSYPSVSASSPMDYQTNHPAAAAEEEWGVCPAEEANSMHWEENRVQMVDFSASQAPAEGVTKKEKHKKEKKEKKEKKKKKHKEKDRERDGGGHKHKKEKEYHAPTIHDTMEVEEDQAIPRLTLKVPQAVQPDYSYSELDASYNSHASAVGPHETEEQLPKLVIKPMMSNDVTTYIPPQAPPYGSFPETAGFTTTQPFPAPMQYAEPIPDADGKIWICPTCGKVDDGSPMIGCDGCDEWFHWTCVGITEQPPEDVEWFCGKCAEKDRKKKKKRKKEKR
ncbi:transcription initiation factor TFIID subunit 3-like isoform X2 [Watersipora subatra]|uniref:transcription initiation factor TFIID subunit 3-like isoform X2 n=1 Tax=Watersipora subatra TaxID=2589382 RepID=UPI00355BD195